MEEEETSNSPVAVEDDVERDDEMAGKSGQKTDDDSDGYSDEMGQEDFGDEQADEGGSQDGQNREDDEGETDDARGDDVDGSNRFEDVPEEADEYDEEGPVEEDVDEMDEETMNEILRKYEEAGGNYEDLIGDYPDGELPDGEDGEEGYEEGRYSDEEGQRAYEGEEDVALDDVEDEEEEEYDDEEETEMVVVESYEEGAIPIEYRAPNGEVGRAFVIRVKKSEAGEGYQNVVELGDDDDEQGYEEGRPEEYDEGEPEEYEEGEYTDMTIEDNEGEYTDMKIEDNEGEEEGYEPIENEQEEEGDYADVNYDSDEDVDYEKYGQIDNEQLEELADDVDNDDDLDELTDEDDDELGFLPILEETDETIIDGIDFSLFRSPSELEAEALESSDEETDDEATDDSEDDDELSQFQEPPDEAIDFSKYRRTSEEDVGMETGSWLPERDVDEETLSSHSSDGEHIRMHDDILQRQGDEQVLAYSAFRIQNGQQFEGFRRLNEEGNANLSYTLNQGYLKAMEGCGEEMELDDEDYAEEDAGSPRPNPFGPDYYQEPLQPDEDEFFEHFLDLRPLSPTSDRYRQKYDLLQEKYDSLMTNTNRLKNRLYSIKKEIGYLKRLKRVIVNRLTMYCDDFTSTHLEIPPEDDGKRDVKAKSMVEMAALNIISAKKKRNRDRKPQLPGPSQEPVQQPSKLPPIPLSVQVSRPQPLPAFRSHPSALLQRLSQPLVISTPSQSSQTVPQSVHKDLSIRTSPQPSDSTSSSKTSPQSLSDTSQAPPIPSANSLLKMHLSMPNPVNLLMPVPRISPLGDPDPGPSSSGHTSPDIVIISSTSSRKRKPTSLLSSATVKRRPNEEDKPECSDDTVTTVSEDKSPPIVEGLLKIVQ